MMIFYFLFRCCGPFTKWCCWWHGRYLAH